MKRGLRRLISVGGAVLIFVIATLWGLFDPARIGDLFHHRHGTLGDIGTGAIYNNFGDAYSGLFLVGLSLATALSFCLLTWDYRPSQKQVVAIYWIFLALLLPVAVLNYSGGDVFVERRKQALVDTVLVFLGVVTSLNLAAVRVSSVAARVMQAIALFFITVQGVFIPAIYALLWWLNWQRAVSLANTRSLAPGWISAVASSGSLAISIMQYRRGASR